MIAIMVFGWIGFQRLGVSYFPDVDYPMINIQLTREGASPDSMETEVVDIIEDALMSIDGVEEILSSSKHSQASISIQFNLNKDIDIAFQDVQAKVSQAQRLLPNDIDPPIISKVSPEDQPIMWIGLTGYRSPQELSDYVRYKLRPIFQAIPGVADVMLGGFQDRNIRVWIDSKKLEAYHLTVDEVIRAIQNEHIEVPAGRIENRISELNLRFKGEAGSVDAIKNIVVKEFDDTLIRLKDVVIVEDGLEDKRRIARSNSVPAQGIGIKKMRGANAVAVAKKVRAKVEELQRILPSDLNLYVAFDISQFIEESIAEIEFALLLAVILTAVVTWIFLGSINSTLNVVLAIPTSLLGTFAVMYFSGFTLNMITLLSLSLSVGIVVDDSIMVLENIYRHAERGLSRKEASSIGARQITFAALAATLAIVAIFLPVAFMKGLAGRFFFQFGVTLSVAVLFSYLEAVTLTPARCSQILTVQKRTSFIGRFVEGILNGLRELYKFVLPYVLQWRYVVIFVSTLLFIASLSIIKFLGKELHPAQDQGRFLVRLIGPAGISIYAMDELVSKCEKILLSKSEVKRYFAAVGGFGGGDVNTAVMFVTLVDAKNRSLTQEQMIRIIRKEFNSIPGLRAVIMDLSRQDPGGRRNFPIEVTIKGRDWDILVENAQKVIEEMKNRQNVFVDVDSNYVIGPPEVRILPNRERVADIGVSVESVGNTIRAMSGGVRVAKFEDKGRRYDIRVRLLASERLKPHDVEDIFVRAKSGELVRLSDLVNIKVAPSLQNITRRNRERAITITANMASGISQAEALKEVQNITKSILPEGYTAELTGGAQAFYETFENLIFAMVLGVVIAYMLLASQFNSYLHPFTVLIALPFSLTGALLALFITNHTLNIVSLIGVLLLFGIVKKNSIILVDYTNQLREEGKSVKEALLQACPIRLRPILMTSFSTITAAIPPALALGPGGEFRIPMAITVIGGMLVSTFLTLLVVPSIYHIFEDIKKLFKRFLFYHVEAEVKN